MDKKTIKAASSFAIHYKRVHGESLSVAGLVAGLDGGRERVELACQGSTRDAQLEQAAREFAHAMGYSPAFSPAVPGLPRISKSIGLDGAAKIQMGSNEAASFQLSVTESSFRGAELSEHHWAMILACAREVAGPMSDVWIEQAKNARPATLQAAIVASKKVMGAFGDDFAKALRRHLRS